VPSLLRLIAESVQEKKATKAKRIADRIKPIMSVVLEDKGFTSFSEQKIAR